MTKQSVSIRALRDKGVEVLRRPGLAKTVSLPVATRLEAPCSLKWTQYEHSLSLGAFSYQVSGYCFGARIGRYCSIGEEVQIGRQNHPMTWASSSPAFYNRTPLFELGDSFKGAEEYHAYSASASQRATEAKITHISHDVWIGHGAYIAAGVRIGPGAVVGAHSVVTRNVPAFAVIAGNPAEIKRFRIPPTEIAGILESRWWRFAPWQLQHLDTSDPAAFSEGVMAMADEPDFGVTVIDLTKDKL